MKRVETAFTPAFQESEEKKTSIISTKLINGEKISISLRAM
jgi:hypothetical protein